MNSPEAVAPVAARTGRFARLKGLLGVSLDDARLGERSWARAFSIDPRSLALVRILTAAMILYDLYLRVWDLHSMWGPQGVLPMTLVRDYYHWVKPLAWSFYFFDSVDSVAGHAVLFAVTAIAAFAVLVGYRTTIATFIAWMLYLSLYHRTCIVLNGGDGLIKMYLLYGIFVPWGSVWSLDAKQGRTPRLPMRPILSLATIALLLQIAEMYFVTAIMKTNGTWIHGYGVQNSVQYDVYLKPVGRWLRDYPGLMTFLSYGTFFTEYLTPLLMFFPWKNRYARLLGVMAFIGLHIGIELTVTVGLFSYASLVGLMGFLPDIFWERGPVPWIADRFAGIWGQRNASDPTRAEFVTFSAHDAAIQPKPAEALAAAENPSQIVPVNPKPRRAIGVPLPRGTLRRWLCEAGGGMLILLVLMQNISTVETGFEIHMISKSQADGWSIEVKPFSTPYPFDKVNEILSIDQYWNMFLWYGSENGWLVSETLLRDGSVVDVLTDGEPPVYTIPDHLADHFPNHRWRLFYNGMCMPDDNYVFYPSAVKYWLTHWNETHTGGKEAVGMRLWYVWHYISPYEIGQTFYSGNYPLHEMYLDPHVEAPWDAPETPMKDTPMNDVEPKEPAMD